MLKLNRVLLKRIKLRISYRYVSKEICDSQDHFLNKYLQCFEEEFPKGKAIAKSATAVNERDASHTVLMVCLCSVERTETAEDQNRK